MVGMWGLKMAATDRVRRSESTERFVENEINVE